MARTNINAAKAQRVLDRLRAYESRNVTFLDPEGSWPIVWDRARGAHVWDVNGRRYLDLTAAFGVTAAGHANPRVVRAGRQQMARLLHAMGDVHPHALKAELARALSRQTFERWAKLFPRQFSPSANRRSAKTIFCNSGFEAVEAALKTALLATGKPGLIAFRGAYHGLGYGALNATQRAHFRAPFKTQLRQFGHFVDFPAHAAAGDDQRELARIEKAIRQACRRRRIGAILVEPIQVRGGIHVPNAEFLRRLRSLCDRMDMLLILDEIYTGFGRTGAWFACEHSAVVPDLICLGKALTGGFPLSACVGRADLMDRAWPASTGEAIHTSTFLGHPVGCAMALAQLKEIQRLRLVQKSARLGAALLQRLRGLRADPAQLRLKARGRGLLAGVELILPSGAPATEISLRALKILLQDGFIFLPEGEHANVLSFTPPLTISEKQLETAVVALQEALLRATAAAPTAAPASGTAGQTAIQANRGRS